MKEIKDQNKRVHKKLEGWCLWFQPFLLWSRLSFKTHFIIHPSPLLPIVVWYNQFSVAFILHSLKAYFFTCSYFRILYSGLHLKDSSTSIHVKIRWSKLSPHTWSAYFFTCSYFRILYSGLHLKDSSTSIHVKIRWSKLSPHTWSAPRLRTTTQFSDSCKKLSFQITRRVFPPQWRNIF